MTRPSHRDGDRGSATLGVLGAGFLALAVMTVLLTALSAAGADGSDCGPASSVAGGQSVAGVQLTGEQTTNAATIVTVTAGLHLPAQAATIAVAVAMTESRLRNLSWGDHTSVGLFQQLNAWGSFTDRTTPATATTMFLTGGHGGQPGLIDIRGWKSKPLTVAAQDVQRSATPRAYRSWAGLGAALVAEDWPAAVAAASLPTASPSTPSLGAVAGDCAGSDGDGSTATGSAHLPAGLILTGSPAAQRAVRYALAQLGKPYRWGASGPDAFDCSGLTMTAWAKAGLTLPHHAADQAHDGTPVPGGLSRAQGGDLVFIPGADGTVAEPGHVGMIIGYVPSATGPHLWLIHAPRTGQPVQLAEAETWARQIAAVRHLG